MVSQLRYSPPSCVSSFHNAKERDKWHSRCRQKPIAFATYSMTCRGIVLESSLFSWDCDVYGSIRGMQILSLQILPRPPPLTSAIGTRLASIPLSENFWRKIFEFTLGMLPWRLFTSVIRARRRILPTLELQSDFDQISAKCNVTSRCF